MSNHVCPYSTLSVPRDATPKQIKSSYRKLALQYHPDKQRGSEADRLRSAVMFPCISNAYETLSDERRRRAYDVYVAPFFKSSVGTGNRGGTEETNAGATAKDSKEEGKKERAKVKKERAKVKREAAHAKKEAAHAKKEAGKAKKREAKAKKEKVVVKKEASATTKEAEKAKKEAKKEEARWKGRIRQLLQEESDDDFTHLYTSNPGLAGWLSNVRRWYERMALGVEEGPSWLTDTRILELEKMGVRLSELRPEAKEAARAKEHAKEKERKEMEEEAQWQERIRLLRQYKEEHDGDFTQLHKTKPELARWICKVRNRRMESGVEEGPWLTDKRIQELERVGFWLSDLRPEATEEAEWQRRIRQLTRYKEENGDILSKMKTRMPGDPDLRTWFRYVCLAHSQLESGEDDEGGIQTSKVRLTEERIRQLNDLGLQWCWKSLYSRHKHKRRKTKHT